MNTVFSGPRLLFLGAALLTGCTSASPLDKAPPSTGTEALTPEARAIVSAVVAETPLVELCAGGPPVLRVAVRRATIRAMMAGELAEPRASGSAAGHFLADRCRQLNGDD